MMNFPFSKGKVTLKLLPQRLRGEIAKFDIKDKKNKIIVEKDKRITVRHIREIEKAGITSILVPSDYLIGRVLAKKIIDGETGEIIADCNTTVDEALLEKIASFDEYTIHTLFVNDLDNGLTSLIL